MTIFVFALIGGFVGSTLLGNITGFVFGALGGVLAGWVADLAGRVRRIEQHLELQKESRRSATAPPPRPERREPTEAAPPISSGEQPPSRDELAAAVAAARRAENAAAITPRVSATRASAARPDATPSLLSRALRWLTTGNVPVKVGVVLSVFGVGFLVKEGMDRRWLVLPLELRLVLVALFGIGLLALGWRLRARQRNYALSVQGGGIAVLYLTTYASFALYGLLPAPLAFFALVAVTAATGALAVLQDSRALAVLGIVGGFMAPVLASTSSGNHVALFGYYAILDAAIVAIAWFKAWRVLNVLGFVFTFGVGALWGGDAYTPELFATTEPFLVLFVLMYLAIPVLFAMRQAPELKGFVDGTLVFGTPLVGFALQSQLVADTQYGLALSAIALAALYVGVATYLFRRGGQELRVLAEAELALGVAFLTVAVPLALDARWTSAAWALQGAALVWLGFRQRRRLALAAGLVLQALAGGAFAWQPSAPIEWPIFNGYYLGALLLALAGLFSGRLFDPRREHAEADPPLRPALAALLAAMLLVWAGAWWFTAGVLEIERHVADRFAWDALLWFACATALLAVFAASRFDWPRLNWLGVMLWPVAVFVAAVAPFVVDHPAEHLGWLAWPAVLGTMLFFLRMRDAQFPLLGRALHVTGYWLTTILLAWEGHWLVGRLSGGVWPDAAALAIGAGTVLATLRSRARGRWPIASLAPLYTQIACGGVVLALLLATLVVNVQSAGDPSPLPYVPLLNPLELASTLVLLVLLVWLGELRERESRQVGAWSMRATVAAAFAWFLVTMAVARTVHHWTGVPYEFDRLAASTTLQGALSIVWGAAGLAAMLLGARGKRRVVWLAGALLMTIVVVKLLLVDLGNTGTLARVVSFLGVGLLLLVVGYFAPVPPRTDAERAVVGH